MQGCRTGGEHRLATEGLRMLSMNCPHACAFLLLPACRHLQQQISTSLDKPETKLRPRNASEEKHDPCVKIHAQPRSRLRRDLQSDQSQQCATEFVKSFEDEKLGGGGLLQ